MKALFLTLLIPLTLSISCFSQDNTENSIVDQICTLPSRSVISTAVDVWVRSFDTIVDWRNLESSRTVFKTSGIDFRRGDLMNLRTRTENCNNVLVMRFYLDADTIKLALSNLGDTTTFLIKENGESKIVLASEVGLYDKFLAWEDTLKATNSPFIYVKEFYYCWSKIFEGTNESDEFIYFIFAAHSVSPSNPRFESKSETEVGYFAIDITFAKGDSPGFYNFAAPCPRVCYNFETRSLERQY